MNRLIVIPARGGSKRIPKKNIKEFLGKPIISYVIETALQIGGEVMVSTEDKEIAKISLKYGAKIPFMRSKKNASDTATTVDVLLEVLQEYEKRGVFFDQIVCIYPTAIFTNTDLIKRAISQLEHSDGSFPIVKYSYPPQRGLKIVKNKLIMVDKRTYAKRTQDIEPIYHDAGQFYVLKVDALKKEKKLYLKNSEYILMLDSEVQDIDDITDWKIAKMKYINLYE